MKLLPGAARRLRWKGDVLNQAFNLSAFAEQMLVHEHAMVKIGNDIPLDRAALVGCGVMTGVGAVFHAAKVEPGSTVVVIGCGGIGLSAVNGAALAGAERIIAIDTVASKLELAKEMGATDTINASNVDPVEAVKDMTGGGRALFVRGDRFQDDGGACFAMLRPGGVATIIGMIPFGTKIELHGADFLRDRKIQGTSHGRQPVPGRYAAPAESVAAGTAEAGSPDFRSDQAGGDQRGLRPAEIGHAGEAVDRFRGGVTGGGVLPTTLPQRDESACLRYAAAYCSTH